ncbi:MAG: rhomboid family intramembrane serine protease [Planctomycetota bacterium]
MRGIPRERISAECYSVVLVLMFLATWVLGDLYGIDLLSPLCFHGQSVVSQGEWWRLFTGALLHANVVHILFNLMGLRDVLPAVVRLFGEWRAQVILWMAVVGGAVAAGMMDPDQPGVGISGGLFGLIGAYWVAWKTFSDISGNPVAAMRASSVGSMVIMNFALGLMIPQVSNAAHFGGLVVGWCLGKFWVLRLLGLRT